MISLLKRIFCGPISESCARSISNWKEYAHDLECKIDNSKREHESIVALYEKVIGQMNTRIAQLEKCIHTAYVTSVSEDPRRPNKQDQPAQNQ